MVEFSSVALGFSLTQVFTFSLGLLYYIDFKTRQQGKENRIYYLSLGVFTLLVLLLLLMYAGKTVIYNSFLYQQKDTAFRFLTMGIVFGIIPFPFVLRASTRFFIKV
ncbi:MAG: hypothetical protein GXN94_03995 [Aquificae bacterium]|nr:hypothetical protein [Aquificota bacterium]